MRYQDYRRMHILDMAGAVVKIALGFLLFGLLFSLALVMMRDAGEFGTRRETVAIEQMGAAPVPGKLNSDEPETDGVSDASETPSDAETLPEDKVFVRVQIYREGDGDAPEWYRPDGPMAAEWTADERYQVFVDSRGAKAYGWEITEAIRLLMLETGGESDEDIRAHCEVIVKQLEYAQTVGGWDDWGTTLYGILHSHSYTQTNGRIWTEEAAPTERLQEIFWDVWYNGYETDFRVQCFRSDCFHSWAIPAYQIGNTYYSINPWQDFSMFD